MKPTKTWILIADGARARILAHSGPGKGLHPVDGAQFAADHPPTGDINADKPGRAYDSAGEGRHGMESPSDPHRDGKKAFANVLADYLDDQAAADAFDRLVLVASPVSLGDLRVALSARVAAMVMGDLDRDLTQVPNQEIGSYLEGLLAI